MEYLYNIFKSGKTLISNSLQFCKHYSTIICNGGIVMKRFTVVLFFFTTILIHNTNAQWSNVSSGLGNKQVYSFTNNSTNLFAGTFNYGLYTSTDNGMSWTQAGIGLNNRVVFSLTTFGNYLYAGTDIGIYRTSNNGAYWSLIGLNNNSIYSLASNQTRVFAGLHNSGLFYSSGGTAVSYTHLTLPTTPYV